MDVTWTIGELAERAATALAAGESAQLSGRVRDLPNERLIRWYTTIGLVDPPAGRRGRTALYGRRHLLQLVAVKRRQASGRSIAEIQLELAAAPDAALERIAALPPGASGPEAAAGESDSTAAPPPGTGAPPPADGEAPPRERFWNTRPDVSFGRTALAEGPTRPVPPVVQGVRLAPDLTLLLEVGALSAEDLHAIESAARPLLDELAARGLIASPAHSARPPADPPRRPQ